MDKKQIDTGMTYQDAAKQLVRMAAMLNNYGSEDDKAYEAVAIACGLLFDAQTNFGQLCPIAITPTVLDVNTTGAKPI